MSNAGGEEAQIEGGLGSVLSALGAALTGTASGRDLPAVFENEVRSMLAMRAVRLREIPARYQVRLVTPTRTADAIVLGVPTAGTRSQAVLEAFCEPNRALADTDIRMLTMIAQLGGLVLEATRARAAAQACSDGDGAAPLIGSTRQMQALREQIERVALTDFTILIEGPICR
jgi:DNA-binding NtrC family response regulator